MATDYIEGDLTWRQRAAFRLHLMVCDGCRAFMQQMRRTIRLVGALPRPSPPPETEARVLGSLPDDHPRPD